MTFSFFAFSKFYVCPSFYDSKHKWLTSFNKFSVLIRFSCLKCSIIKFLMDFGIILGTRIKAPRTKSPRTKTPRIKAPWTKSPPDKNPAGRKPLRIKAPRIKAPLNNAFSENWIDFFIFNSWWNFEQTLGERVLCKNIRIYHVTTNIICKILWLRI